jgi:hypothetical protein
LVARSVRDAEVAGSSPAVPTPICERRAGTARLSHFFERQQQGFDDPPGHR